MGYGWHHSLKIENISKVDSSILVLDKIVEGDDDGIWKWFYIRPRMANLY